MAAPVSPASGSETEGFLRREHFIELTAGIVAGDGHPPLTRRAAVRDLSGYPWIDYDAPAFAAPAAVSPADAEASLDPLLERLFREAGQRVTTRLRAAAAALLPMAAGPWLARLAAGLARPAGGAPAQAAVHPLRPAALQGRLHRPALGRGPRAVPGAGGNRARDRPAAERPIPRPERSVSVLTCRLGNRVGSPQDANPRVSSAPIARSRKPWRLEARGRPDDKRTIVSHSLVDGRSSRAGRWTSLWL